MLEDTLSLQTLGFVMCLICTSRGQVPNSKDLSFQPYPCPSTHYYRNANLSRLGNPCCPGFPTGNARPGQKGVLLSRVWQPGQKGVLLSRVWQPGQKVLPAPRGWRTLLSRLVLGLFFSYFLFLNSFSISIILLHFN